MKLYRVLLLILAAALLLTACKSDDPAVDDDPTSGLADETPAVLEPFTFTPEDFPHMDGSPSTVPLAQAVAATMLGITREDVQSRAVFTRTTQAYRNLANGWCDILIAGEPSPAVLDEISRQGFSYTMAPIALDALVFIVSETNPVDNLTTEQIRAIYSGELTGWQQVGGNDLAISPFQRNEEATSQVLMEKLVMDWGQMVDPLMQTIISRYPVYDEELTPTAIRGFDGSPNAIGYTMYHYAVNMAMADGYKILSIDGVLPTKETIASGAYPLTSPYYAVINSDLPEDDSARILYNWLLSDEGQALVASEGYVPIKGSVTSDDVPSVPPPQMRWGVVTNDSKLTPYNTHNNRRSQGSVAQGALQILIPSGDYGFLLPYSTAVTMNDGSIHPVKYGFVARDSGDVITAPIYDYVQYIVPPSTRSDAPKPSAYHLHMNLPEDDPDFGYQTIQAACASDGSWITPFFYVNIVFCEDVILLRYDYDSFDIDVYDYSGNLLYNMLDLDWADEISMNTFPEFLLYSISEGYGFIQLDDDTYAAMHMLSGEIQKTDFVSAFTFSDGLVSVMPNNSAGMWGFANRNLEIVIEANYVYEAVFVGGQAVVETPDGKQHVIDRNGEVLFSADTGHMIMSTFDNYGYTMYSLEDFFTPILLDSGFNVIEYPPQALPLGPESSVDYIGEGWYTCNTENGIWLISADETYALPPGQYTVVDFIHGFIIYAEYDPSDGKTSFGIMTPGGPDDGIVVHWPEKSITIEPVVVGDTVRRFIINTDTFDGNPFSFIGDTYRRVEYRLVDPHNQRELSGSFPTITDLGILSYDEVLGYLYVQGSDYFAWLNTDGEMLMSIPSMAYTFD